MVIATFNNGSCFVVGGYVVANAVFVLVRLTSVILSVLTFWYGLALNDSPTIDVAGGNFNTQIVRYEIYPHSFNFIVEFSLQ